MSKKLVIVSLVVIVASCSTIKVVNVNDVEELKSQSLIYSLPKTILDVKVELTKTTKKKGPYSHYAQKYLGINSVILKDETVWNISDINISENYKPDNSNTFIINSCSRSIANKLSLSNDGVLHSLNNRGTIKKHINKTDIFLKSEKNIEFYDISVKKHFEEVTDTTYKIIRTDSSSRRIPVYSHHLEEKNIEKKAEEAANFIIKIRKRRLRILTGKDDVVPKGEAAKSVIDELNKMEKKYIELFVGVEKKSKVKYNFKFEPKNKTAKPQILFKLLQNKGIVNNNSKSGTAYYISVKPDNYTNVIDSMISTKKKPINKFNGLVYRIPEISLIEIYEERKLIASKNVLISQFGVLNIIPGNVLKQKNIKVQFYQKTGALKSISKENTLQHKHKFHGKH